MSSSLLTGTTSSSRRTAEPLTSGGGYDEDCWHLALHSCWCLPPFLRMEQIFPEVHASVVLTNLTETDSPGYLYSHSVWVVSLPSAYISTATLSSLRLLPAHEQGMREQAKKMGVNVSEKRGSPKDLKLNAVCAGCSLTVTLCFMAWPPTLSSTGEECSKPIVTPLFFYLGIVLSPKPHASTTPSCTPFSHPTYPSLPSKKKLPCLLQY
ncbi:rhodopsin-like [Penaeus monodon]|uniref:rhodopsin-like n=1 Tax=Penaeus monodon TaxID=6687 RepID=UPI0018A78C8B|nr:rhodopsin-like [Penaeus monodon]